MDEAGVLEDVLAEWLEVIDGALASSHEPIPNRPFEAARMFIEHALVAVDDEEVVGEKLSDYVELSWFKKLHKAVENWYEDKYGPAMKRPADPLRAAILFSGSPFGLHVPRTLSKVETPGETAWLTFPAEVQEGEDPLSWIQAPPNFARMAKDAKSALSEMVAEIGTCLRTIRLDLDSSTRPDGNSKALAKKILPHLQSAADHILLHSTTGLGLAAWDSYQAAESVLKLLCRQRSGTHRHIHDLADLLSDLEPTVQSAIDSGLVNGMPDDKRIVELRAGEGDPIDLQEAQDIYLRSLRIVRQSTQALDKKGVLVHNASFLIKKAPWID